MKSTYTPCAVCTKNQITAANYTASAIICDTCMSYDKQTLVQMVLSRCALEQQANDTAAARKRTGKLTSYLQTGKRCTHGHHYKPITEYDKCAPRSDGLQPACRACNKLRVSLLAAHGAAGTGLQLWHLARDAMRDSEAAKQAGTNIAQQAPSDNN